MGTPYALTSGGVYGLTDTGAYGTTNTLAGTIEIEYFETDLSNYTGDTGSFGRTTSTVHDGTYALEATATGFETMHATSGINQFPQQGDTYEYYMRFTSTGSEGGMAFAYDGSGQELYRTYVSQGGKFEISKWVAGSDSAIAGGGSVLPTLNTGEWYKIVVEWNDGDSDIVARVFDNTDTEVSGSPITAAGETDYNYSGIGWHYDGGNIMWDTAQIQGAATGGGTDPVSSALIDSFEDQDMSEYTQYAGDGNDVAFVTGAGVTDGTFAFSNDGDTNFVHYHGDNLTEGFGQGDTLRVAVYFGSSTDGRVNFHYGKQDADNYYTVRLDADSDDFDLRSYDPGETRHAEQGSNIGDAQYWIEIEWTTGNDHNIDLYDSDPWSGSPTPIDSISVTDSTFTSGDIGFDWDTSGSTVAIDDIRKVT